MICDMADVDMRLTNEEEKDSYHLAPTPRASHNPGFTTTGDGGGFQTTKSSKMSKTSKSKDACDTKGKMSVTANISKNAKNASNNTDTKNLSKSITSTKEEVAVTEITRECPEMCTL
jgi:hypothetical protein